jgi:tyrosyl-tRNA synthetase
MFGKIMSISDELMWRYYLLLTDLSPHQIDELKGAVGSGSTHPLQAKKDLAHRIVTDFHGDEQADAARKQFESNIQQKGLPPDIVKHRLSAPRRLFHLLVDLGLAATNSEAQRLIKAGSVYMNRDPTHPAWQRLTNANWEFDPQQLPSVIFRVGSSNIAGRLRQTTFEPPASTG